MPKKKKTGKKKVKKAGTTKTVSVDAPGPTALELTLRYENIGQICYTKSRRRRRRRGSVWYFSLCPLGCSAFLLKLRLSLSCVVDSAVDRERERGWEMKR
jgi:hypothetical protein